MIKRLIYESVRDAAILKMIAAFPFLSIPVIKQFFIFFAKKIIDQFYDEASIRAKFVAIEFRVKKDLNEYNYATEELRKAIETKDEDEINEAKKEFKRRLSDLIRINT